MPNTDVKGVKWAKGTAWQLACARVSSGSWARLATRRLGRGRWARELGGERSGLAGTGLEEKYDGPKKRVGQSNSTHKDKRK